MLRTIVGEYFGFSHPPHDNVDVGKAGEIIDAHPVQMKDESDINYI